MAPQPRGSRPRHVPQRTCIACRQSNAKRELERVVRAPDGRVELDPSGKRNGRGAYVHTSPVCWQAAVQRGLLARALKIETIMEDDLQQLNEHAQRLSGTPETVASSPPLD